jgi:hypothetical protein
MEGDRGKSLGISGRTAIAATAGGVAAELGGGKFANGAMSAAFVHLFNAENWGSTFDNYIMGNANEADMNAAYGEQFEKTVKNALTTTAEVYAIAGTALIGGPTVVGAKACYPVLKGLYYRNAHHTQKVLDFITSSLPGVPAASGSGVVGSYIQGEYHPEELLR